MINLSEFNFSTRHRIYRNVSLLFLGEPTTIPFSRALLAGLGHESKNFRRHHQQNQLPSVLAGTGLLVATLFCVIVWQKTTLPQPSLVQGQGEENLLATPIASQSASAAGELSQALRR